MPTFCKPGGRTFAGGDMMPLVMPWPKAGRVMSMATNAAARMRFELLVMFSNAFHPAILGSARVEQAFRPASKAVSLGFSPMYLSGLKPPSPASCGTTKVVPFPDPMPSQKSCPLLLLRRLGAGI